MKSLHKIRPVETGSLRHVLVEMSANDRGAFHKTEFSQGEWVKLVRLKLRNSTLKLDGFLKKNKTKKKPHKTMFSNKTYISHAWTQYDQTCLLGPS